MIYKFGSTTKPSKPPVPKTTDVVRLSKQAQPVFDDALAECYERGIYVTPGKLVSDMILFAAANMRFEEG